MARISFRRQRPESESRVLSCTRVRRAHPRPNDRAACRQSPHRGASQRISMHDAHPRISNRSAHPRVSERSRSPACLRMRATEIFDRVPAA
jgi:hypothetical protein